MSCPLCPLSAIPDLKPTYVEKRHVVVIIRMRSIAVEWGSKLRKGRQTPYSIGANMASFESVTTPEAQIVEGFIMDDFIMEKKVGE